MQSHSQATQPDLELVRVEYVNPYISTLRQLGVPVDRELRKARLPTLIEELSGAYISTHLAYRCLMGCIDNEGIGDLGFMIGWNLRFDDFSPEMTAALNAAPTLNCALQTFARLATIEDSALQCRLQRQGDSAWFAISQNIPENGDSRISEWPNLKMVIEIIRRYAAADWLPPLIALQSAHALCPQTAVRLEGVTLLTGQAIPRVQFPAGLLALPPRRGDIAPAPGVGTDASAQNKPYGDALVDQLRAALLPYLASDYPPVDLAAEIAGTSVRSLQRRLFAAQITYSELIETVRFERAQYLLMHTQDRILDIAISLGYRDASNFARAIRRISGFTPGELRRRYRATEA